MDFLKLDRQELSLKKSQDFPMTLGGIGMRFLSLIVVVLSFSACGTDKKVSSDDREKIAKDVTASDLREFDSKVVGKWSSTSDTSDESIEGCSFSSSSEASAGKLFYFLYDASGETKYELISKQTFQHAEKEWTGWIIQDHFFADRSVYYVVCHSSENERPKEILFSRHPFSSHEDCFSQQAKKMLPFN